MHTPSKLLYAGMRAHPGNPMAAAPVPTPHNRCQHCGATAYKPVLARDGFGAMRPSGQYQCVRCKVRFTHLAQWRQADAR